MTALAAALQRLDRPPRIGSLVITVWGDAVVPRGGSLWLGTLQEILAGFGCKPGQLRTAMSRLTEEGWLLRSRQGRLSFYRLGAAGEASFDAAARRIYAPPGEAVPGWDGAFRLALASDPAAREALLAQGFAPLGAGWLIGTEGAPESLPAAAPVMLATPRSAPDAAAIAARAWPGLPAIAEGYHRFIAAFAPLAGTSPIPDAEALPLRLLLVHEYRRLALRDPGLPAPLLPAGWPRAEARRLSAALYRRLLPAAEAWLSQNGRGEDGALPAAEPGRLAARFRAD